MDSLPVHLGNFVLLRLCAAGKSSDRAAISRCLEPYFSDRLELRPSDWRSQVAEALLSLQRQGLVDAESNRPTRAGRAELKQFLHVKTLPKNATWRQFRNRQLVARALEVSPKSSAHWNRLASAGGLRAAIVVRYFDLRMEPLPTLTEALNALALKQAGEHPSASISPHERDRILREILRDARPGKLEFQIPAEAVGAVGDDAESLRLAVINRWLDEVEAADPWSAKGQNGLRDFANVIQRFATAATTGRYGENKVFLSQVWSEFQRHVDGKGITRADFNQRLLAANQRNLLTLSRADLTIGMNSQEVEESEIRTPYSTFHFLKTD